jgi:hypothetical protein
MHLFQQLELCCCSISSQSLYASYAASEVGCLSHGSFVSEPFLSQPHQILCGPDGKVICTNTGRNSVMIYDQARPSLKQEVRVSDARWDRLSLDDASGDHINSLFERDGHLYVIAHGHKNGSKLAVFNYPTLDLLSLDVIENRTGLHNIWVTEEGQKISCHSEAGSVVDLNENKTLWRSGSPVYTRGLAASADYVLVGESQRANRGERKYSDSAVWVVDRRTWQAVDYLYLGSYGAVHEVRLVDTEDEAHHGAPFLGFNELLHRDCTAELSKERVRTSLRVHALDLESKAFDLVYGAPSSVDGGGWSASDNDVCLFMKRSESSGNGRTLGFHYTLDYMDHSHVSVAAYRGHGADTDMHAILIQRSGNNAAVITYWINDGTSWVAKPDCVVGGAPISGTVEFFENLGDVRLKIDGRLFANPAFNDFSRASGELGIRWAGSTISQLS